MEESYEIGALRQKIARELEEIFNKHLTEHMSRLTDDIKDEKLHQAPMNMDADLIGPSETFDVEKRKEDSGNKDLFDALDIDEAREETN
mgnify:FL=1